MQSRAATLGDDTSPTAASPFSDPEDITEVSISATHIPDSFTCSSCDIGHLSACATLKEDLIRIAGAA